MHSHISIKYLVLAGLFTTFTAVGAFIKIPFYPVPFTLQSLFPVLAGMYLIPRYAVGSQLAYLILGLMGLPVFANGGGIGYALQPTFGYLLCLPLAAGLVSWLYRDSDRMFFIWIKSSLGLLLILIGGALWLYFNLTVVAQSQVSFIKTVVSGAVIFFPSMLLKSIVVTVLGSKLHPQRL